MSGKYKAALEEYNISGFAVEQAAYEAREAAKEKGTPNE